MALSDIPAKFIAFEGIDGVGKSTQLMRTQTWLQTQGVDVITTREPGGTVLGEALRQCLLSAEMDLSSELLLLYAARNEHVIKVIKPNLANNIWVLSDRFHDGSFAYQGGGKEYDSARLRNLDDWVLQGFKPDLTLLLDMPANAAIARQRARNRQKDRFESLPVDFFDSVRTAYLARQTQHDHIVRIDAALSPADVQEQITACLTSRYLG